MFTFPRQAPEKTILSLLCFLLLREPKSERAHHQEIRHTELTETTLIMVTSMSSTETEYMDCGDEKEVPSIERVFEGEKVPGWREQLTFRAFVVSMLLGVMFSVIVMKLNLTTGIIPSLNVSAGLLGFFFVRMWTKFLEGFGALKQPFTRQENTVIQTCVVACCGIAFSGN